VYIVVVVVGLRVYCVEGCDLVDGFVEDECFLGARG